MKRAAKFWEVVVRAVHQQSGEMLHEQIPLRDMSDCLLAVYDEVSRRAFQSCIVRGAQEGSDREDWKAAEDDLFARISVDFEESGGNLYALASLPGCAGAEITVAVDEGWLLIAG
jgi:HSP20 family molecular chaperone IbpA